MDLSEQKNLPNIIIDLGSNCIKFGFSSDPFPKYIIPNAVAKDDTNSFLSIKKYNNCFCGYDALSNSPSLNLSYPLIDNNGKFLSKAENIRDFDSLFHYIFQEKLQVDEVNYKIFLISSIFTSTKEQEMIAQILFEKFHVFNLLFEPQSVMALYSTEKTSGLIVNSGEMSTEIVPIYEGYIISDCINEFPIGGYEITKNFVEKYKNDFEVNDVCNKYYMAQKIKEKYTEIFPSHEEYENIMKKEMNKKEYNLPDGNIIEIGKEIYEIPESIFHPEIFNIKSNNLPQMIVDSINKCDISIRKELLNNIILGGGNTCIKGFDSRLKSEINNIKKRNCGIISLEERMCSAWIGASRLSSSGNYEGQWISRHQYYTTGGLQENDYVFNYSGLNRKKRKQMNNEEIFRKLIIREKI